jgi:hypothetical protein
MNYAVKLFNFKKFGIGETPQRLKDPTKINEYFKLISTDKIKLMEFGNIIVIYEGVVQYYNDLLQETKVHAKNLIETLKKEYHIE